jgi:hypothetical protein
MSRGKSQSSRNQPVRRPAMGTDGLGPRAAVAVRRMVGALQARRVFRDHMRGLIDAASHAAVRYVDAVDIAEQFPTPLRAADVPERKLDWRRALIAIDRVAPDVVIRPGTDLEALARALTSTTVD